MLSTLYVLQLDLGCWFIVSLCVAVAVIIRSVSAVSVPRGLLQRAGSNTSWFCAPRLVPRLKSRSHGVSVLVHEAVDWVFRIRLWICSSTRYAVNVDVFAPTALHTKQDSICQASGFSEFTPVASTLCQSMALQQASSGRPRVRFGLR